MNLLYNVFIMSVAGSLVYILYKGMEQITKRFASATWHYNLLKVIALFLIIPLGKITEFSTNNKLTNLNINKGIGIVSGYAGKANQYVTTHERLYYAVLGIWLLGMAVILLRQLICYIRFRYIVSYYKNPANVMLQWIAKSCAVKQGIRTKISLYVNEYISTPMLIGFFSPIVLLPSDNLDMTNAEYIISHELTHYKKKDLIIKFLMLIIRTVHWFNPVVYLISRDLDRWCEYACDEYNAIDLTIDKKKKYGLAILDAAAIMPVYGSNFGTPFLLPKQNLKERLVFMMNVKKMSRTSIIFAFIFTVILMSCGFITATAGEVSSNPYTASEQNEVHADIKWTTDKEDDPSEQKILNQLLQSLE